MTNRPSGLLALALTSALLLPACAGTSAQAPAQAQPQAQTPPPSVAAASAEEAIIDAVATSDPAVVSVIITKDLPKIERVYEQVPMYGNRFPGDSFFSIPQFQQNGTEKREVGGGTAFFVTSDGLLMTNRHVVEDEQAEYTVLLNDGKRVPATVVGRDTTNDIALLKIDGSGYPFLTISSAEPRLGQTAIAIGNALGEFRNTVSVGIVSGLRRSIVASGASSPEHLDEILQTDAAINEGNSGGPLIGTSGEVIGMNTAVSSIGQNIGFALPASELSRVLANYRKNGRIVRTYIGVRYEVVTPELKDERKLPVDQGVLVAPGEDPGDVAVLPGSPAEKAGIKAGDLIVAIDGTKLTEDVSLLRLIQTKSPGETARLTVLRDGREMTLEVTVQEMKE